MDNQHGLLSVDMLRTLLFLSLMAILSTSLFSLLSNKKDANDIERHIDDITTLAQEHYNKGVMTTQCLAQPSIDISQLKIDDHNYLGLYEVSYNSVSPARPHSVTVRFTFTFPDKARAISRYLQPSNHDDISFYYQRPLEYQLVDFQHLDRATGCLQ
jgi:hypothetical protein